MKPLLITSVALLIAALLPAVSSAQKRSYFRRSGTPAASSAHRPPFGRPGTPTVSPYLNLVPGYNLSPALTYYRSYRPEREFRRENQELQRSISTLQREVDQLAVPETSTVRMLNTTGHPTSFHDLSGYFPQRKR